MLSIRMDDETYDATGGRHKLDDCPGFHREEGWYCDPGCQVCHVGPCDDFDDAARGTNGVLAYVHLLPGARLLRGTAANLGSDSWSVRLHEHSDRFINEHGDAVTVWSVMVKDRSVERLYVSLHTSRVDADALYDSAVADLDEECFGVEHVNDNVRGK
jgi:hypothetical protein